MKKTKPSSKNEKGLIWFCLPIVVALILGIFLIIFIPAAGWGIGRGEKNKITPSPTTTTNPEKEEWKRYFQNAKTLLKVPWEFIAAITWQETGMGQNLGSCSYFPPPPERGHVLTQDKGLRSKEDKEAFERIASKLGISKNTGVSCPANGGSGGAMGYTQVMPREWESYSKKLEPLIGHYPNPWNAQDATYMAALILKGKVGLGVEDEFPEDETLMKKAAARYHGSWPNLEPYANPIYARYLEIKNSGELP